MLLNTNSEGRRQYSEIMTSNKADTYYLISKDKFHRLLQSQHTNKSLANDLPIYNHSNQSGFGRIAQDAPDIPQEPNPIKGRRLVYKAPPPGLPSLDDNDTWWEGEEEEEEDNNHLSTSKEYAPRKKTHSETDHKESKGDWYRQWQSSIFKR